MHKDAGSLAAFDSSHPWEGAGPVGAALWRTIEARRSRDAQDGRHSTLYEDQTENSLLHLLHTLMLRFL